MYFFFVTCPDNQLLTVYFLNDNFTIFELRIQIVQDNSLLSETFTSFDSSLGSRKIEPLKDS